MKDRTSISELYRYNSAHHGANCAITTLSNMREHRIVRDNRDRSLAALSLVLMYHALHVDTARGSEYCGGGARVVGAE